MMLENKTALIYGGGGAIGGAVARAFARAGARVYLRRPLGELEGTPQTFIHKMRVAEPGSLAFGPERVVATEPLAIPFGGLLHANDFRVATVQKSEIAMTRGGPRVFVVWNACPSGRSTRSASSRS